MGRNTQGVLLIRLSDNEKLCEIERVARLEGDEIAPAEGVEGMVDDSPENTEG